MKRGRGVSANRCPSGHLTNESDLLRTSCSTVEPLCVTSLSCLSLTRLSVRGFRTTCTEWSTSSWWTSTRTSGARPPPPCPARRGHTAVSPPGELTASPTGTRDFSLFSKRTEPHWTGPEHSSKTETAEAGEEEQRLNHAAKDGPWLTLKFVGGRGHFALYPWPLLFPFRWWNGPRWLWEEGI